MQTNRLISQITKIVLIIVMFFPLVFAHAGRNDKEMAALVFGAPAVVAARARVDAARERANAAGLFPNPTVEGMASRASESGESWPKWEGKFQQPLPKAGERRGEKNQARAVLEMAEAEYYAMAGEMAADTAMAIAEAEAAEARSRIFADQVARIHKVLELLDTRVAAGQGRMSDKLKLQSRAEAMKLMADKEKRMAADALSDARGRLGLSPNSSLPNFSAPSMRDISEEHAPMTLVALAKVNEALAMQEMARASARPMSAVGLQVSREEMPMQTEDMIGVSFMIEIPWNNQKSANSRESAALAEKAAAESEISAVSFRIKSAFTRIERAEKFAERARMATEKTVARLDAEYDSYVTSAGTGNAMSGESTLVMVVDILENQSAAHIQIIDAQAAAQAASAELWKFAGLEFYSALNPNTQK